jgi:hypothetical protein
LNGDREEIQFRPYPHNHLPPPKPLVVQRVKTHAVTLLHAGLTPAVLQKQLVNAAPTDNANAHIPSIGQLKIWKYRDAMADMPYDKTSIFFSSFLLLLFLSYYFS